MRGPRDTLVSQHPSPAAHCSRWNWGRGVQPLPCGQSWHLAGLKYGRREDRTGCTTLIWRLASLFVLWGINVMRGRPDTELPSVLDQGDSPHARPRRPSYREKAASRLPFELPGFRASQELLFCSKHQEVLLCLCSFSVALTTLYKSTEPHGHPQPHPKPRAPSPFPAEPWGLGSTPGCGRQAARCCAGSRWR